MKSEAAWFEEVRKLLQLYGWTYYHTLRSDGSTPGFPDLIVGRTCPEPRLLAIELKSDQGVLTPAQRTWLDLLEWNGIPTYIWRPSDLDSVVRELTAHVGRKRR